MLDPSFQIVELPGPVDAAGFAYGRLLRDHLTRRLAPYLSDMAAIHGVEGDRLTRQAAAWAGRLPARYSEQMAGMAEGAGVTLEAVQGFLYADIASPAPGAVRGPGGAGGLAAGEGGCSGAILRGGWVARNCDWHLATLRRGTAAVVHRAPHRIPCMALGLMGDIDVDTGVNAERLWLHVHTLLARDEPRAGVSVISWLFWLREALETCASLADLERTLAATDRDRGVMIFAADGKTGERAIYECTRSCFRRIDPGAGDGHLLATNHPRDKHPPPGGAPRASRAGSTVSRYNRLRELLDGAPPERLPDDLIEILGDPMVEMREAATLRTIYSAVADPARGEVWFGSGGAPAASRGTWRRIPWPW